MRFEFDSVSELAEFLEFCSHVHRGKPGDRVDEIAHGEPYGKTELGQPLSEIESPEVVDAASAPKIEQVADVPSEQKRKRRTKAEMEAARAAEQVSGPEQETPTEPGAANPFAQSEPIKNVVPDPAPAPEAATDAADFIKSRLAERPEVSQVEHLNMARTFIGKHGMDKYNQSFALASLSNNVMGYSPTDCAAHAAALDFLSLE